MPFRLVRAGNWHNGQTALLDLQNIKDLAELESSSCQDDGDQQQEPMMSLLASCRCQNTCIPLSSAKLRCLQVAGFAAVEEVFRLAEEAQLQLGRGDLWDSLDRTARDIRGHHLLSHDTVHQA